MTAAGRYANHPADVEDIAQEALIRAWRFRDSLHDRERVHSWLAKIVRNEAVRDASRRRPEPAVVAIDVGADDERMTRIAGSADLHQCLSRLGADERLILRLRYEDDLTQAAIARYLDMPEGTVKIRLHRARGKLRKLLSES